MFYAVFTKIYKNNFVSYASIKLLLGKPVVKRVIPAVGQA